MIRTGHYIPPKSLLRIGAPNQFCLHLLPGIIQRFAESEKRAVGDDGNSMSTPVTDITVLEPRELMDGLRLLHHDYIDILLEGCVGPLQVPFSTVDRPPLLLRNVVLMHKRFLEKLDPAGCHSDYIVPADLARLPVISAITPMLTAAFDSPSLSRIQVPTSEAVRRLAEQGHGAGILINLRSLLGVPPNAATYEEVRAYFSQRDLALRWFPICDEEKPSFFKMEQVILVTRESAHPSSLIKRFKNAVADECKEISQNGLVLPKASIS
jgi:DNA-binding transcriptional LysR family regulator